MERADTLRESRPSEASLAWHTMPAEEALSRLQSGPEGLAAAVAEERLRHHGPNALVTAKPAPWWRILWEQIRSFVVLLLVAVAAVAMAIGDYLEAAAIGAVLAVNVALGFWVEWRARRAMDALRRMQAQEARVVRGGEERRIDARGLVPGDVIVLEAGEAIAADARIIEAAELRVVEAPLTGESLPADKSPDPVARSDAEHVPLGDRTSMVYKGTLAANGRARAVVVATGRETEIGRISELVSETEAEESPLERRLRALGHRLVWITLAVAAVVAGLGIARGEDVWLMVETGIALAIAAVPEGLPVVATITLALGMQRMARRHALVRRLPAVETLGSATVVCADKTGTLTAGEMTVTAIHAGGREYEVTGTGYAADGELQLDGKRVDVEPGSPLELTLRIGALCNRAAVETSSEEIRIEGDPTEAALLVAAEKAGLDRDELRSRFPEFGEVPFSSERMWMATFHRTPEGRKVAYIKGAPRQIVSRSSHLLGGGGADALDDTGREWLLATNRDLARRGLRVLGLGFRELREDGPFDESAADDLTFTGFTGMIDPAAPGVQETIRKLREAGVHTVMITGDQSVTAEAVARELGILEEGDETLDGRTLASLPEEELTRRVARVRAFSRVSPQDKLQIVRAFQSRGEVVGMLGDGVNDAPALKRADIGVAMGGRGTDVAKETAAVVLEDDRFETVGVAVEEGRAIFDNIRKFIFYLFSCNLSEVLVLFLANLLQLPLPLLPLQILWLNFVTDVFPALALAVEPAESDVMERPPRDPQAAILSRRFLTLISAYAVLITGSTLGVFAIALRGWEVGERHAVTLSFMTLALAQLFHVFNARREHQVLFSRRLFQNGWAWGAVALTVGLQLMAIYVPLLQRVLRTEPLGIADWGLVLAGSLLPLAAGQAWKALRSVARARSGAADAGRITPANG